MLTHPILGRVEVGPDDFKRLDYGRGFAPKFRKLLGWRTEPMPEPQLGGEGGSAALEAAVSPEDRSALDARTALERVVGHRGRPRV